MRTISIVVTALLSLALAGCKNSLEFANSPDEYASTGNPSGLSPGPSPSPSPGPGPSPTPGRSAGCGKAATSGTKRNQTISVNGTSRSYKIYVPGNYNPNTPLPLIFSIHASGGTSEDYAGLPTGPGAVPSIIIWPQGQSRGGGTGWTESCTGADVAFFDALVDFAEQNFCIDTKRRFAWGFSWGADMSMALACCRGSVYRAIFPQSGGEGWNSACQAGTPAFQLLYGTKDDVYGQKRFTDSIEKFRSLNSCQTTFTTYTDGNASCKKFDGCTNPVTACSVNMGHDMVDDWNARVWKFFKQF